MTFAWREFNGADCETGKDAMDSAVGIVMTLICQSLEEKWVTSELCS